MAILKRKPVVNYEHQYQPSGSVCTCEVRTPCCVEGCKLCENCNRRIR